MKQIYLDNASTTKIAPEVLEAILPYLKENFGNASSIHQFGQKAREAVDKAREQLACFLNCQASEIIFTGSATEADNLAVLGVAAAARRQGIEKPHLITTAIEHPAVLEVCRYLEKQGLAEVSYLAVGKEGIIRVEDFQKALQPETVLVSIMYANNEIGTVQPIAEIAKVITSHRHPEGGRRPTEGSSNLGQYPLFHTDAVQAVNYLDCDVEKLGVGLLTLSGHKIYGPKGIGALYVRQGAPLELIIFGGHQEFGLRPGTENVANIVGLGKAIELIQGLASCHSEGALPVGRAAEESADIEKLRNKLIDGILQKIPDSQLNGSREKRLPNNVNVTFKGAEGEALLMALDQEGIAVSTGSACSSGSLEPSYVLLALGLSAEQAHGSIRLTLGWQTTEQEIDKVLEILPKVVVRLRKVSGYS